VLLLGLVASANAEVVTVDVTIKSVDVTARTITVEHNGKTTELDLSRKATILVAGKEAEASSLIPGDKATVEYHKDLEVVTKIEAEGLKQNGWRFFDVFNKVVGPEQAFVLARDGRLVCLGKTGGFCLTSLRELAEFRFSVEFRFPNKDFKSAPFISVASTLPNPKGTDFFKQFPFGIEVKLHPDNIGELTLPRPDFKAELPLGQLRDDRKVVPLRKPELKIADWNTLEITCDEHQNVTVKVNGTTVNAIAKAETTTGYVVIFPQNAEMQFRNPVIVADGKETPLPFDTIVTE
jgi:hypothetical protein